MEGLRGGSDDGRKCHRWSEPAMSERGIIFTGESVRAILAGRKTQTRRVLRPQPNPCDHYLWPDQPYPRWKLNAEGWYCGVCGNGVHFARTKSGVKGLPWPKHQPGDLLWVRETLEPHAEFSAQGDLLGLWLHYRADASPVSGNHAAVNVVSPIFMPRW